MREPQNAEIVTYAYLCAHTEIGKRKTRKLTEGRKEKEGKGERERKREREKRRGGGERDAILVSLCY
jgi:hypothetical protein